MDDRPIFETYKKYFEELTSKGFKPKLNIMDNQATKHIKQFLSENDCKLQLVEPHNHRVNVAEHAIQTFKDAFIAALAITNVDFPLQLWDKLTPQVQTCLNLMRRSHIDPSKSAYQTLYGVGMTGTDTHWPPWDAKQWCMKTATQEGPGPVEA
jgi:hypothetical protein